MSTIQNEIDRIKESVADAYETVELMGGDVPSPDLQKIDTLSDSIATIKGGSGGGGSENILLNWDFRNPVNRSGSTTYSLTTTRCTVDSWYSENGCAVNVVDGGVTFDPKNDATCVFGQNVKEWELMKGKIVTFSALVSNATASGLNLWIYGVEGPVALPAIEVGNDVALYSITGTVDNGASSLRCGIQAVSSTATIKMIAAKLEYGSKQTLAKQNSDNVWEILDPPNYDLQYILCSQYDAVTNAWIGPQDKITGTTSQTAGFDANGNLAAVASAPVADAIKFFNAEGIATYKDMNSLTDLNKCVNCWYPSGVDQTLYHTPLGELYGSTLISYYVVQTYGTSIRTVQLAYSIFNNKQGFFIRFKHDATWFPWREIASLSDIPTVSNPNLLLNWDFRNPVNRNGKTEYTKAGYAIDKWYILMHSSDASGKVTLSDGGIMITKNSGTLVDLRQYLDQLEVGKTYTFSALSNGILYNNSFLFTGKLDNYLSIGFSNGQIHIIKESGRHQLLLRQLNNASVNFTAVKLELGSTQTLAKKNASGEWEIIDPPNYDLQYLLTSQYSPINGAYVGIQHSNPNLLDNWYFADPINQRGQTEYADNGYTIDRWVFGTAGTTLSVTNEGLQLNNLGLGAPGITQKLENWEYYLGKTITLSAMIVGGNGFLIIGPGEKHIKVFGLTETDSVVSTTFKIPDDITGPISFGVRLYAGVSSTIKAMKVELGPVQTLARKEGDIWVLNDPPPNKQQELAKCQRYLQVYGRDLNGTIEFKASEIISGRAGFVTSLPVPMRANPTVINEDSIQVRLISSGTSISGDTSFTFITDKKTVIVSANNNNIQVGSLYRCGTLLSGKRLIISAEL